MGLNEWDTDVKGQLSLFEEVAVPEKMFAVSDIFARAKKQMSLSEYKTFVYALTEVKWTEEMPNVVYLDKKTLASIVGIHTDPDHLSVDLHQSIEKLPQNSFLTFADKDLDLYESGVFVTRVTMLKNRVKIKFEEDYLSLFGNLQKDFITMWGADIFQMRSERSITFYEYLRYNSDTRIENEKGLGVKFLKELFGIPKEGKGSYMREKGGFNRAEFEKKVIDPLCEDLSHCKMLQLIVNENGKLYEKVKSGNRVMGYRFRWVVSDTPTVTTALENKEIREAKQNNPLEQKIKKDILTGEKRKPEKAAKNEKIHNFHERDYSTEEETEDEVLSRIMLENTRKRTEKSPG